jgi:hypothetical protein
VEREDPTRVRVPGKNERRREKRKETKERGEPRKSGGTGDVKESGYASARRRHKIGKGR